MILLYLYLEHKKFDGEIALLYFAGYGIGRALIESIRTDQLYITGTSIPVSMVLGLAMAGAAICAELIIRFRIREREKAGAGGVN